MKSILEKMKRLLLKIETPQLRGLEVTPQLMRSETKERIKTNEQRKTTRDPFEKIFE